MCIFIIDTSIQEYINMKVTPKLSFFYVLQRHINIYMEVVQKGTKQRKRKNILKCTKQEFKNFLSLSSITVIYRNPGMFDILALNLV